MGIQKRYIYRYKRYGDGAGLINEAVEFKKKELLLLDRKDPEAGA